ncbi:MAG TPA: DUF2182 domain-containing protein [Thermoplasmata archaeon]|nr:DUF2182 domain-containing protein [Thermoplasmata archaeon]
MEASAPSARLGSGATAFEAAKRPRLTLPAPAWSLIGGFALVTILAWLITVSSSNNLFQLLSEQLSGANPVDRVAYIALVGVMMLAMMLPAALPMVAAVQTLSAPSASRREGYVRATLFSLSYFVVWSLSTAAGLVVLMLLGLMGSLSSVYALIPGLLLVGAGVYQFTTLKQYCLTKCRSPLGFLMTNWREGRSGALRMGLDHSVYCIGCCWLLMGVVFITGAMSLLWMGVFSALILLEKVWSRGEVFSRLVGGAAIAVGGALAVVSAGPWLA